MIRIPFLPPKNSTSQTNIDLLLSEFEHFVFLSPHIDDAVFSCGLLLFELKRRKKNIRIVTFFSRATRYTVSPQAKVFLNKCGYDDPVKLFSDRKKEDILACKYFKAQCIHKNFIDAAWRLRVNGDPIYSDESSQFSGYISDDDRNLLRDVSREISMLVSNEKRTLLFAPLGIAGHADHVIIREAVRRVGKTIIFWEDFPYYLDKTKTNEFSLEHKEYRNIFSIKKTSKGEKERAIRLYKTQMNSLFPHSKIPVKDEKYYVHEETSAFMNF